MSKHYQDDCVSLEPEDTQYQPQPRGQEEAGWQKVIRNGWFIGLWVIFFNPVGVVLTWLNPRWKVGTKWAITAAAAAWFGVCVWGVNRDENRLRDKLERANVAWESGNHDTATALYTDIIDNNIHITESNLDIVDRTNGPMMFGRVIDHYAISGDTKGAAKYAEAARKQNVLPACKTPEGKAVLRE